jgi:RimJ/RimL family protein N-acetyltransferase/phospholipid N-methyltransferase
MMMNLPIETSRLILRQFTDSDAAAASYNSKQPSVARNMSDMILNTEDDALKWIHWINNEKFDTSKPFLVLAVILKSSEKCIGLIGVAPKYELDHEIEILFEIADEYQNLGYATEAAKAIIWWAFEKAGQSVLSAIIKPTNKASKCVIEKLGFLYENTRTLPYDGKDTTFEYYRLYHLDYLETPEWDMNIAFQPEEMGEFFTARVGFYDRGRFAYFKEQYERFGTFIPETKDALRILDIGCGSGIEFAYIWAKAPNAHITGVDLSDGMLNALAEKYADRKEQWTAIKTSYFDYDYPQNTFDIVVSCQTMHHFLPEQKLPLYRDLHKTLKPGGFYLECDFIVDESMQKAYWARYERIMKNTPAEEIGRYHIDIPCSLETQKQLLTQAEFSPVVVLEDRTHEENCLGILRGEKQLA